MAIATGSSGSCMAFSIMACMAAWSCVKLRPGLSGIGLSSLALPYVLIGPFPPSQRHVDVAMRIHPATMGRQGVPAGYDVTMLIHQADTWRQSIHAAFANIKNAIPVHGNVQGTTHIGPHREELPISREDLDAVIF